VTGVSHEDRYLVTLACPWYPPSKDLLFRNVEAYPVRQLTESLKAKHGPQWDLYYKPPRRLRVDALDEAVFDSVHDLNDTLERLTAVFGSRNVAGNWEQDFCRMRYLASPVEGDKTYFEQLAISLLGEGRCQISSSCKKLSSKDSRALCTMGIALSVLEKLGVYEAYHRGGSRDFSSEENLAASYS